MVLKGRAKRILIRAFQLYNIPELLKANGLPYKTYSNGRSAITFEFGVSKEGWYRDIRRQKVNGVVQAIVDLKLAIWELTTGGNDIGNALSLEDEVYEFYKGLSPEKIEFYREKIREGLKEVMIITDVSNRWEPLPRPEIVAFSDVFDTYYTPEQVASILKVERERVVAWCREGVLKALKAGRKWRIPEKELYRFLEGSENNDECPEELQ